MRWVSDEQCQLVFDDTMLGGKVGKKGVLVLAIKMTKLTYWFKIWNFLNDKDGKPAILITLNIRGHLNIEKSYLWFGSCVDFINVISDLCSKSISS